MTRLGWGVTLALLAACGSESGDGGSAALSHYNLYASVMDFASVNFRGFHRELDISIDSNNHSRAQCGSLRGMKATLDGMPIEISSPGGWSTLDLPTETAPGETVTLAGCDFPFLDLVFDPVKGEPQNGTLAFDDGHAHFETTFHHDVGSPTIELVSATADQVVIRLKGFLVLPDLDHLSARMQFDLPGSGAGSSLLQENELTTDGLLTLGVPAAMFPQSLTSASLSLDVSLGDEEVLPCVGFNKCLGIVRLSRTLEVDFPQR